MKILYVKLVGYIGIYYGLGKQELELDLSKGYNRITVITGQNASGKSSLMQALHILPDDNSQLVPTMTARKEILLQDEDILYNISILHPLDSHGNRATTKASLIKNGEELNPNGNISSYKEIISNEFGLNTTFMSLSFVTGNPQPRRCQRRPPRWPGPGSPGYSAGRCRQRRGPRSAGSPRAPRDRASACPGRPPLR